MGDSDERTLYVGNLHADVTDEILYEFFLQAGPIEKISRPKDRDTGNLKNFGFILFSHAKTVPYAVHLTNGIKLFGYNLKCQARGTAMLPHFSEVGIHSIDNDNEKSMDNSKNDSHNDSAYYSSSKRKHRRDDSSFKPKPLDPKQTWRNTIDYQEDQMKQSLLGCSFDSMSPNTSGHRHRSFNSASSNSPSFGGGSSSTPARSASHYHNLSKRISSELSGELGGDLRSRLGKSSSHNPSGNSYRSQRDHSNYGRQDSYNQSQGYNNYNQSQSYNSYNQSQGYGNYNQSQGYGNYNQSYDNSSQSRGGYYDRHSSYDNSGGGYNSRKEGSDYNSSQSYDRNKNKRNNRYYQ